MICIAIQRFVLLAYHKTDEKEDHMVHIGDKYAGNICRLPAHAQ